LELKTDAKVSQNARPLKQKIHFMSTFFDKLRVQINLMSIQRMRYFVELHAFGVCSAIGEKLGIASAKIRMWFIYISFLTLGSPLILYMILAFWMRIKKYILLGKRNPHKYF